MTEQSIIGWDIGGAHLKVASLHHGSITATQQYATPLWQGLSVLDHAIDSIKEKFDSTTCQHVLTMTGELVDLFKDRHQGVDEIIKYVLNRNNNASNTYIYAGRHGFIKADNLNPHYEDIASANWHATASLSAQSLDSGYLLDIGTTTTDIIPFASGQLLNQGYTDQQRMRTDELIYTGVVRTPVMAVVGKVLFQDKWQSVAAEYFATMADVYRLTGELSEEFDLLPTADGAGKSQADSRRRLARMLGADVGIGNNEDDWVALARFIGQKQYELVQEGFLRIQSQYRGRVDDCIVATGAGRFLIERLAVDQGCKLYRFEDIVDPDNQYDMNKNNCAAAISLAHLFHAYKKQ